MKERNERGKIKEGQKEVQKSWFVITGKLSVYSLFDLNDIFSIIVAVNNSHPGTNKKIR